jgi:hypothetical protein
MPSIRCCDLPPPRSPRNKQSARTQERADPLRFVGRRGIILIGNRNPKSESPEPKAELREPNKVPPRFSYWTILIDGQATAFRARQQADLLPTLVQLRRTNPTAEMKWFARGRIWDSPAAATEAQTRKRRSAEARSPDWRPGGNHKDPRARFQLSRAERRRKFARRQRSKKRTP